MGFGQLSGRQVAFEDLVDGVGQRRRERRLAEPRLGGRSLHCIGVDFPTHRLNPRFSSRAFPHQIADAPALLSHGRPPSIGASGGLTVPLQKMMDQDLEPVAQLTPIAPHQSLELLGDVGDVERGQATGAQVRDLLGEPEDVVGIVERRLIERFCHGQRPPASNMTRAISARKRRHERPSAVDLRELQGQAGRVEGEGAGGHDAGRDRAVVTASVMDHRRLSVRTRR